MVANFAQEPRLYTSGTACRRAGAQWRTWHSHGEANARAFFGRISLVPYTIGDGNIVQRLSWRLSAGAVLPLCAKPLWCELYDIKDEKKIRKNDTFLFSTLQVQDADWIFLSSTASHVHCVFSLYYFQSRNQ